MKISVAGTGRMGTALVRRLIDTGHQVRVWNRTAANARDARDAGAAWAPTLRELANGSDAVISFLLDNTAVERVYLGADGLLAGCAEGKLFIDMSTVSAETHRRIGPALASRRAAFMECPVSGSIAAVHAGNLVGFAGGDAATVTRALPLLVQLCRRVEHVGMLGAGARMKLAANLLLVVFWQALGESLLVADPAPGDAARALDLLADSNIGASILRTRGAEIVAAMNGSGDGISAFDVDTMRKDLGYMVGEAGSRGMSLALAQRTLERFDLASREGKGSLDGAAYPAYFVAQQIATARRPAGIAEAR